MAAGVIRVCYIKFENTGCPYYPTLTLQCPSEQCLGLLNALAMLSRAVSLQQAAGKS